MTVLPQVALARIREHAGTQHRAFEELAYLLAWDLESLDRGTEIERRAAPDGGVEFSCVPGGEGRSGRWAWQAKYLFRFDDSTFSQMTKSVIAALDGTPDLKRYIFVLPKDRSTAGLSKWKSAVKRWTKEAKNRNMKVEFDFRGESQLLAVLTGERHAGAIRYFFDEAFLTEDYFARQVEREVNNLGDRYDPRVNVETEARYVIDAACRGPRFVEDFTSVIRGVSDNRPRADEGASSEQVVRDGAAAVEESLEVWNAAASSLLQQLSTPGSAVFTELAEAAVRLKNAVESHQKAAQARVEELNEQTRRAAARRRPTNATTTSQKRKTRAQQSEDERDRRREVVHRFTSSLYRLLGALDELLLRLRSNDVKAAIGGSVLLVGEAGCGKSHLVADLAKERVAANLPSLLLLGQVLVKGVLDPQLVTLLGLGSMTLADVFQALDVAARVRNNGRTLLVIDAINEGAGADLWEHQLCGFVAEVKYEWLALVITVRDVYENAVAPSGAGNIVRSVHRGLAGHEEEALTLYANLYELRLPDIPALLPELSNPLFLRSLCQSVRGRGLNEIPREAASLVWVFDGLVDAVDQALGHPSRLDYGDWENKVGRAVRTLAAAMVDVDSESLALGDATTICLGIHADQRNSYSLLNGLIVEGLLLRERVDRDGQPTETVRFTYQRLSDHLRADVLMDRNTTDQALATSIRSIADGPRPWAMSGIIEALVLLVPERRGKELATVLRLGKAVSTNQYPPSNDSSAWLRYEVQTAFIETLVWRSPSTFTPGAMKLLRRYLDSGFVDSHEWLRIITGLACVPGHPLNVNWLDPILWDMPLPDRDNSWSRPLLWVFSDDVNPIGRTIDWAWSNPDAPEDVARLASTFLSWLFTSPNRRLRDTATKALVAVTSKHTHVVADLVEHFGRIDDPYVLDRVVAAAYGHVLRRRRQPAMPETTATLIRLGQGVFDAVFATNPTTHLMTRHRARSCIRLIDEICSAAGTELHRDLTRVDPPYPSSWPLRAPAARQLAKGFGRKYDGYLGSATELDWEFERNMERLVADLALPNQKQARSSRRRALVREQTAAAGALIDATPPSRKNRVRRAAEALCRTSPSPTVSRIVAIDQNRAWEALEKSLSRAAQEQARKLRAAARALDRLDDETLHPDPKLCTRWVAARVLALGWTKERFGDEDRRHARSDEHTIDRIAQKYERIALQELCGHLADHCLIEESWRDISEAYEGPWQITEALDLDPSLLLRGDEPDSDTPAARLRTIRLREENRPTWWRTFVDHRLSTDGTDDQWLGDTSDIPRPEALLKSVDPLGREWLAIERHQEWSFKDPTDVGRMSRPERRNLWFRSQANIIRADDTAHPAWAANTNWMGLSHLSTPQDVWTAYLGEYPDVEPWPTLLDQGEQERRPYGAENDPGYDVLPLGWAFAQTDASTRVPYVIATVTCHQDAGVDFAAADTPSVIMPSRMLLDALNAHWSGGRLPTNGLDLGPVEREYSWLADGEIVAFCTSGRIFGSARILWVRAKPLRDALANAGLAMWSWTLGEKIYWGEYHPSPDRTNCFAGVRLAPGPEATWGYTIERDQGTRYDRAGQPRRLLVERGPNIPASR